MDSEVVGIQNGSQSPMAKSAAKGLSIERKFSKELQSPFDAVSWEKRECIISGSSGEQIFLQKEVEVPSFWSQMAATVVASKYFHGALGSPEREASVKTLLNRVVGTIVSWGELDGYFTQREAREIFRDELTYILLHQQACFNSPVWFNVGVEPQPQCSACFILSVEDDMESLLELQAQEGLLFRSGSGCGTNLSSIRSSRERISGGGVASGPIPFMRGYDSWAGSIKSGGKTRRAAKMQILNASHPDIIDFITCKSKEEKKAWALIDAGYDGGFNVLGGAYDSVAFQNANFSVRVDDGFMESVQKDTSYWTRAVKDGQPLQELKAREVLRLVAECAHLCGDPGIQFDDTINAWHTCPKSGRINASNPCSEYMHLDNSACNLSSINLLKFLREDGSFDVESYCHTVRVMMIAQDILIDRAGYPSKKIERCARDFRQLGLGYANLGALLMSLGLAYDSREGRQWASLLTAALTGEAYRTSAMMAAVKGPFAGFKANRKAMIHVLEKHAQQLEKVSWTVVPSTLVAEIDSLWQSAIADARTHGVRNSQATVLAPTGTIAFMMDCDTTGIEPDLALVKYKKLAGGGMLKIVNQSVPRALRALNYTPNEIERVVSYIDNHDTIEDAPELKLEHLSIFDCAFRPAKGVRAIGPEGHLQMMAAAQPFLSGAISKTVNLSHEATPEDIFRIFVRSWQLGLKAVAVYRDCSKRTQPLSTGDKKDGTLSKTSVSRRKLPDERRSITHKFSVAGLEGYLTTGLYEDGSPGEIFLVVAKEGSTLSGVMDAFATCVSLALQHGVPLTTLVRKFTFSRFEPAGFTTNPDIPVAQSIIDYVFRWMALKFLSAEERVTLGLRSGGRDDTEGAEISERKVINSKPFNGNGKQELAFQNLEDAPPCTRCGSGLMVRQGGCYYCLNCGNQGGCG